MRIIFVVILSLLLLSTASKAQQLTVHEWGTFTTLHGSSGGTLSGLYLEEEQLPSFVYHFPGFSPDTGIGVMPCKGVTVKMETPVLYFYSAGQQQVHVRVGFPHGIISQWYPNRSAGEDTPAGDTLNLDGAERTGLIEWNATVLDPTTTEQLTQTGSDVTAKWYAPRMTDANLVKNGMGEIEKYLFYRGLANFSLPVTASFVSDKLVVLANTSSDTIPFIYVYDHTDQSSMKIWATGPLSPGESRQLSTPSTTYASGDQSAPEYIEFGKALIKAGLTDKEAAAMLQTWQDGYFQTIGFKVFWVVPRKLTDQILPLSITPTPSSVERVLVGKTEILTAKFEQELLAYYKQNGNLDQWKGDRYYAAYSERVKQLTAAEAVQVLKNGSEPAIFPNPATSNVQLLGFTGTVTVRNLLGEAVGRIASSNGNAEFDVRNLTPGLYFVFGRSGRGTATAKFVKQ